MGKVEIRPGVWMAYEDHWFGEPWTAPETVVMIHGNSESSRAWTCWVPHLARHYRGDGAPSKSRRAKLPNCRGYHHRLGNRPRSPNQ